jgi:copper(I)-binding protein
MRTSRTDERYGPVNSALRGAIPALLSLVLCLAASCADAAVVTVSQPWVRPATARATTPVYMVLGSSEAATLVKASSPLGAVVLMHGKAAASEIALVPGEPLAMTAQGPHLAIRGLAKALARGERVSLTLVLRDAAGATRDIAVDAEVRLRSPIDDERRAHAHDAAHDHDHAAKPSP